MPPQQRGSRLVAPRLIAAGPRAASVFHGRHAARGVTPAQLTTLRCTTRSSSAAAWTIVVRDVAEQPKNPLHGITLETIVTELVEFFGWEELGRRVEIRAFNVDPSVSSSLKFLRRTRWAREKVEGLYLYMLREKKRRARDPARDPERDPEGS